MRIWVVCGTAVTLALSWAGYAQPAPRANSAPPVETPAAVPPWGAPQRLSPASTVQLSIRGVPGWFRIGVPAGWQLNADRVSGRIGVSSPNGRGLRIWLMLIPRAVRPEEAAWFLENIHLQIAPKVKWPPAVVRSNGPLMTAATHAREGEDTRATGLTLVSAGNVTVAFYAMAAAPTKIFRESREVLAAVLESFTPLPGFVNGEPGLEGISFSRWTDPRERAFSLDVPRGWPTHGGTVRGSAIDVRQSIRTASPDGSLLIELGDGDIPPFVEPGGAVSEGRAPALVMPYQSGAAFGRSYLGWRTKSTMNKLAIDAARPLPDLQQHLQAIQQAYAVGSLQRNIDPGELLFRGIFNGKPAKGYLFAATNRISLPGGRAMWVVGDFGTLQGFVAHEDRMATAVAVMNRMRTSFEVNPQWFRDNARTVEAMSRMATLAGRHVAAAIAQSYPNTATQSSIPDRYAHYRRDVAAFTDPRTKKSEPVQIGANYYWMGERGVIAGTGTYFIPDPLWFRKMLAIEP
jgi:hypothetical protein